jgi:glycosyltransferase involved in cell wall biosynthesis
MIIIPFYNSEKTIEKCLDSCVNQTFKDIMIVCVDDGSIDNSLNIVEKIKACDNRITCIRNKENESPLVSRFKPISTLTSEYVLFLDSDDELVQTACERLFNAINTERCDIIEFGYKCMFSKASYIPSHFKGADYIKNLLCGKNKYPYIVWNKAYEYDLILQAKKRMRSFYCNMGEDVYCSVVFASIARNRSILNEKLYLYNDLDGISTNRKRQNLNELLHIMRSALNSLYGIIEFINTYNTKHIKYLKKFIRDYQTITLNFLFSHADTNDFNDIIDCYKTFKNSKIILSIYEKYKWKIIRIIKNIKNKTDKRRGI